MEFLTSLFIAISLAMDAFAVSLGIGSAGQASEKRAKFRLAFHFGLFQAMMTTLGWLVGSTILPIIEDYDHWVAAGLLAFVGINMVRSGLDPKYEVFTADPSKGVLLVVLSVATSIDALAVGLSMAMIRTPVLFPSLVIGLVTLGLSGFGLSAGTRLSQKFGKRTEILGGTILLVIGLRILFTHLLA